MSIHLYSSEELYKMGKQKAYPGNASEAAFLLGGIATGNVSLGSRGELRDWEIFNKPGKRNNLPYTFFAIWVREEGESPLCKVLESKLNPPFSKSHGFGSDETAGLPRFKDSELRGEYPMAWVTLKDETMPVEVILEAFTPFIPLNPDDSGIPCAVLKYRVKNISGSKVDVTIAGSISNLVGFDGYNVWKKPNEELFEGNSNEYTTGDGFSGLYMYSSTLPSDHLKNGNISLITNSDNVTVKANWDEGAWFDGLQDMWDDFSNDGRLESTSKINHQGSELSKSRLKTGSLGVYDTLCPGEEKEFLFILTWYFPNRINGWESECCGPKCKTTQNYYANMFKSSWDAAGYVISNFNRLNAETMKFHDALFNSTLPYYATDAVASNITVLRSTTCFRLKSGKFFGWEGCHDGEGCCPGNCTHVWNYAQTLAFLFPSLERDMRLTEFNVETEDNGKMEFRTKKLFNETNNFHPAADGQLGCIIRLYREWKFSGDNEFLALVWSNAKKALEFAFDYWDSDGDYVLDSQQHNTYDIEFYGPNSLINSMFFGALKAAVEMAEAMKDTESAAKYAKAVEEGTAKMDKMLWNGEYYVQAIDDVNKYKYQYGEGCLSDQLLGQQLSHVAGLGYVLPEDHVKKAVASIFKYNFRTDFSNHHNVQRAYVLNDERGLVLCSWPKGGRPKLPFVYSDEVWTGIEYQVAAHLIYEGFVDEGLSIVKAVRDRHDGIKRNPWNEVECGHHYARSMASWSILTALSGFKYDLVNKVIEFNPVINKDNFLCFFSCGKAWGTFLQKLDKDKGEYAYTIDVLYGNLDDIKIKANGNILATYKTTR